MAKSEARTRVAQYRLIFPLHLLVLETAVHKALSPSEKVKKAQGTGDGTSGVKLLISRGNIVTISYSLPSGRAATGEAGFSQLTRSPIFLYDLACGLAFDRVCST
jgi:hypothetical protein